MKETTLTPREIADTIPDWMADALTTDEAAIERLEFKRRDELISWGLACRAWPKHTTDRLWHTWITVLGCQVREVLRERRDAISVFEG